jgi:hypothetical protein
VVVAAAASSLIKAGGVGALQAVQSASIVIGLPLNILSLYAMQSVYVFCKQADGAQDKYSLDFHDGCREFKTPIYGGIFNIIECVLGCGRVHRHRALLGMDLPSRFHVIEFVKGLLLPFWSLFQVLHSIRPHDMIRNIAFVLLHTVFQLAWIFLLIWHKRGLSRLALFFFAMSGIVLAFKRHSIRHQYNLRSNLVADIVSSAFFWPQVLVQLREETMSPMEQQKTDSTTPNSDEEEGNA